MPVKKTKIDKQTGIIIGVVAFVLLVLICVGISRFATERQAAQEEQQAAAELIALKERYPLRYEELIRKYAEEFSLQPSFIAAIICCESTFNAEAVSEVDARGLMQIMPDTGKWLAGKFGEEAAFEADDLFDPETNIRYACWYLHYLDERFASDKVKVIAAYHAGQGQVDKWLDDPDISADGKTLTTLPEGSRTAQYVERVQTAQQLYIELYNLDGDAS